MRATHFFMLLVGAVGFAGGVAEVRGAADEPAPQTNPMFLPAHEDLLAKKSQGKIDVYFLGDSITRRWHGNDNPEFQKNWKENFHGWNAANFGWGGDSTRNVLWRLEHGELDGVNPKVVVLMIGTNNINGKAPADEAALAADVAKGVRKILDVVREQAPDAKIVLMGIMPRNDGGSTEVMSTINRVNEQLSTIADGETIRYLNVNDRLVDEEGKLFDGVTVDQLHLSVKGYQIWADALKPILTEWLGPPGAEDHAPPATGPPQVE